MSGIKRWRVVVALVLAGAVFVGATAQAIRTGVDGARAQRFLAVTDAWTSDGAYYNPLSSTAVVDEIPLPDGDVVSFPGSPTILFFANPHTLSGTRDILLLQRYAEHFGDALRMVWVAATEEAADAWSQHHREAAIEWTADTAGELREQYSGVSLIIAADGKIEQAIAAPTRRETRLYLNKLIPENPFVWEERPLETAVDVAECAIYIRRPHGDGVRFQPSAMGTRSAIRVASRNCPSLRVSAPTKRQVVVLSAAPPHRAFLGCSSDDLVFV